MPNPKDAEAALRRAVDNLTAQRTAAQASRKTDVPQREEGIERADTDADR